MIARTVQGRLCTAAAVQQRPRSSRQIGKRTDQPTTHIKGGRKRVPSAAFHEFSTNWPGAFTCNV